MMLRLKNKNVVVRIDNLTNVESYQGYIRLLNDLNQTILVSYTTTPPSDMDRIQDFEWILQNIRGLKSYLDTSKSNL